MPIAPPSPISSPLIASADASMNAPELQRIVRKKRTGGSRTLIAVSLVAIHAYAVLSLTLLLPYWWTGSIIGSGALILLSKNISRNQSVKSRLGIIAIPLLLYWGGFWFLFFLSQGFLLPASIIWLGISLEWYRSVLQAIERGGIIKTKLRGAGVWITLLTACLIIATGYHLRIFLGFSFGWFFLSMALTLGTILSLLVWLTLDESSQRLSALLLTLGGVELILSLEFLSLSAFPRAVIVISFLGLSLLAIKTNSASRSTSLWRGVRFPVLTFLGIVLVLLLTARWK